MKIPKKMLFQMVMEGKIEKFDKNSGEWADVTFEPGNEEHIKIKTQHYAQAEIDFVHETLELGMKICREIN
mgnify:FL=1